jgi:MFS family permease
MRIPALVYVLSIMLTSICKEFWQFILAQGVLGGVAAGLTFAPSIAAVGQYFNKKRGAAMGVGVAGSSLGGVILPIALGQMLRNPNLSFGWSVRIMGFVILALLVPSCVSVKARLPPRKTSFFILSAFKEPPFVALVLGYFFLFMGMYPPIFFLPSYAISMGMSSKLAIYLVAILNAASLPGRILPGIISDKLGRMNMSFFAGISTGILALCWQACHSNAAIVVFAALFGFCSGAIISGMSVSLMSVPRDARNIGTYIGMGMGFAALATLAGPPASGAMVNHYHGFKEVSIFSGVSCIVGSLLIIPAKLFTGHSLLSKN